MQHDVNYLTGLVSWGFSCGKPKKYGIYSNIQEMKNWIIQTLVSFDVDNNYVIPFVERIYKIQREANKGVKKTSGEA